MSQRNRRKSDRDSKSRGTKPVKVACFCRTGKPHRATAERHSQRLAAATQPPPAPDSAPIQILLPWARTDTNGRGWVAAMLQPRVAVPETSGRCSHGIATYIYQPLSETPTHTRTHACNSRIWKCLPARTLARPGDAWDSLTLPREATLLWPSVQGDYSIGSCTLCVCAYSVQPLHASSQQYQQGLRSVLKHSVISIQDPPKDPL